MEVLAILLGAKEVLNDLRSAAPTLATCKLETYCAKVIERFDMCDPQSTPALQEYRRKHISYYVGK